MRTDDDRSSRRRRYWASLLIGGVLIGPAVPAAADPQYGNPFGRARPLLPRQCSYNDQCAVGLVCAGGYCRGQCRTDRDCARGDTCDASFHDEDGHPISQPTADQAVPANSYYGMCRANFDALPTVAQPPGSAPQTPIPVILPETRTVPTAFAVTAVKLAADVAADKQKCPTTVVFHGFIAATGSGAVTYHMIRSDGAVGAVQTVKFAGTGEQSIEASWTLSSTFSGAISVEILSPVALRSSPAAFALECLQ
jgi:hypothetical protein